MTSELIRLSHSIYLPNCLEIAVQDFRDYCIVTKTSELPSETHIEVEVLPAFADKSNEIVAEFLNYLLDLSVRATLADS